MLGLVGLVALVVAVSILFRSLFSFFGCGVSSLFFDRLGMGANEGEDACRGTAGSGRRESVPSGRVRLEHVFFS